MAFTIDSGYVTEELNKYELPRFGISPPRIPLSRFKRIVNGIEKVEPSQPDTIG